jgi:hypothetical protein
MGTQNIMEELERLQKGLQNSNTLLLKSIEDKLECSFIKEGMVQDNFFVSDTILVSALIEKANYGVVEGLHFQHLRNNYGWFSLKVKSKKLLMELQ